ncbi:Acyl dehydratase [Desulfatibacillum alkenivorans DSM 16219]|jgi:3-hydroxybutyryl-CoA dehydratase|uniref:Acyl dehydratase n=1 Tax=Desulfatibacillum alkenivorans DSM 16219 TaxID=1121393 RepID=A0A1M6UNT8_9BACT|nr:MaoC family dehydratase [Desulfatibacillum alkenivorans]SHK70819.1 Acyl dehydratase [Desulfatibacillum alkenivorans DSM 16219]
MSEILEFGKVDLGYEIPEQSRHITQEKINKNAEGSLDFNPIHIDPAWAKKVNLLGKGTTIAHGIMTGAFMGKIVTDWAYPRGAFLQMLDVKFVHPVRPGDDITARGKVTEKHPRPGDESFVVLELWCENQAGVKVGVGQAAVRIPV